MGIGARRLLGAALFSGVSAVVAVAPSHAQEPLSPAGAEPAAEESADGSDPVIVVTGTRIGGEAPVGTALVQLDPTYGSPLGRVFLVQLGKKF